MPNNKAPFSRYPDFGKMSVQLIERVIEPLLGKDVLKTIQTPSENRQLYNKLRDALLSTEKEFIHQYQGTKIAEGLIQLHLADLKSVQKAFWQYIQNPAATKFPRLLFEQLSTDYPMIAKKERITAVDNYLKILKAQIVNIDDEVRERMSAAVLLAIESHVESMDNKLDELEPINEGIKKIVEILSRFNTLGAAPNTNNIQRNQTGQYSKEPAGNQVITAKRIDFDINKTLGNLTLPEIENLHGIIESWIPPMIERLVDLDDYDRPYGEVCKNVIKTLLTSVKAGSGMFSVYLSSNNDNEHERFEIINKVFKSQLCTPLPGYKSNNSVYLNSLSGFFPSSAQASIPCGYYLVDLQSPSTDSQVFDLIYQGIDYKRFWHLSNTTRFNLVYVSDKKISNWDNISEIENKKISKNWKNKINSITKTVTNKKTKYYFYLVVFKEKSAQFRSLDKAGAGDQADYSFDISIQEFARYITGFTEDFLSLASETLISERKKREYTQGLANQFKKQ
jgi:hypothetical protein